MKLMSFILMFCFLSSGVFKISQSPDIQEEQEEAEEQVA